MAEAENLTGAEFPSLPRIHCKRPVLRLLRCVGRLVRSEIENRPYQMVEHVDPEQFEHDLRNDDEEAFTAQFRAVGFAAVHSIAPIAAVGERAA